MPDEHYTHSVTPTMGARDRDAYISRLEDSIWTLLERGGMSPEEVRRFCEQAIQDWQHDNPAKAALR